MTSIRLPWLLIQAKHCPSTVFEMKTKTYPEMFSEQLKQVCIMILQFFKSLLAQIFWCSLFVQHQNQNQKNGRSILKALHLQYENYDLTNFEGLKFFRKIHTSKQTPPCNIILSSVLMLSKYNIFLLWKLLCFWGLWWLNVVYEFQIIIVIPLPGLRRKYAVEEE